MSKTILYARVSTTDQTLDHQKDQAEAAGFVIDEVVADHGVSGVSTTLQERPEGKRLYDKLRHGDTLVVRWVDRLGRNYQDVTDTIRHFMRQGVVVKTVINGLTFDGATQDPMQEAVRDALIAFMAATAQAQAEATKEAQKAGIVAAKQDGTKYRGKKPSYDRKALGEVMDMLGNGAGASEIANTVEVRVEEGGEWKARKLTRQTVLRIKKDPAAAEEVLSKWGM
ncbi:recombinase family protein [Aliiroseovarius marinus]|uniref:recombinase family protein n=1 Tax=Aliiroseovarius marinus TaxID=2500159 RepID=UPI00105CD05F|nr:recombinase family protein [Aliiroseovarius marinus]